MHVAGAHAGRRRWACAGCRCGTGRAAAVRGVSPHASAWTSNGRPSSATSTPLAVKRTRAPVAPGDDDAELVALARTGAAEPRPATRLDGLGQARRAAHPGRRLGGAGQQGVEVPGVEAPPRRWRPPPAPRRCGRRRPPVGPAAHDGGEVRRPRSRRPACGRSAGTRRLAARPRRPGPQHRQHGRDAAPPLTSTMCRTVSRQHEVAGRRGQLDGVAGLRRHGRGGRTRRRCRWP